MTNNVWFTSDTHFRHQNILRHCPNRVFSSVEEHDSYLIEAWNKKIKKRDIVYHLGDFAFSHVEDSYSILDRLNGDKILIVGNHDRRHIKKKEFISRFVSIKGDYFEYETKHSGVSIFIVMCHYPFESWNKKYHGSVHIHGHTHTPYGQQRLNHIPNRMDIGVDSSPDLSPWNKDEVISILKGDIKVER